jgi:hypothetical protein
MVAIKMLPDATLNRAANRKAEVVSVMHNLFSDDRFLEATRTSTNTPSRVKYRISEVRKLLAALGA